ncbi:MAG TPA: Crp/Fnr family transcriptional regulator [Actinomycetota bacterium]|nr:Crp/Fnr family transcriptional regulator [Actinomycetota bacterium]
MTTEAGTLLSKTELFGGLDEPAVRRISDRARTRTYSKGQLIFHEGDLAASLFVMVEGLVKVFVTSDQGDAMTLVTLRPPDMFGELSLLDGGPRSASAEAVETTRVIELGRDTFFAILNENPQLAEALLRTMGTALRRLTETAADLVFLDLHGRVAKLLVGMADERGIQSPQGIELDLQLTQTDLASMVGGSRQSVNQILRSFERRGYLDVEGRKMIVKQVELLRRRAGL